MIEIQTNRLILRPINISEAADVVAIITKDISRWTAQIPWPYALSDAKNWLRNSNDWERLGMYLDGKLVGSVKMPLSDDIEIGFIISENHRNQGFTFEAATAVIDFAFTNLQLNFISSSVHPDNIPSIKLHEKLGFKPIKKTEHFWPNKGKNMPVILYKLAKKPIYYGRLIRIFAYIFAFSVVVQ